VWCEVSNFVRWVILAPVDVGQRAGYERRTPLGTHHRVQIAVGGSVLNPELVLPEAEVFSGFGDGSSADSIEDELAPEFVFGAELVVFPRSFTS